MSFRRALASILVALATISVEGPHLAAQLSSRGTSLIIPITGVADLGGMFSGALLIERFTSQANTLSAVGTVTGALTANGMIRNLVMQVVVPLDVDASRARLNTDAALAQASCEVLHVELGSTSVNVLGSTIALNPVAFDIASTLQSGSASAPTSTASSATASPTRTATASQPGTVNASPSTNTTQPGMVAKPAVVPAATQTGAGTAASLASLLCSVDRFRDVSNPASVAQQLNGILAALGPGGQ